MVSAPVSLPGTGFAVPAELLYLLANVATRYVCIPSVFVLTSEYSSLTVTLVVTLRKFLGLNFFIIYFKNSFTVYPGPAPPSCSGARSSSATFRPHPRRQEAAGEEGVPDIATDKQMTQSSILNQHLATVK